MIRARTWTDSGRPLGGLPFSNTDSRLAIEPDRSREESLGISGVDSRDVGGDGDLSLVSDVARSTTEGDRDVSLPPGLRTEKNVEVGRSARAGASTAGPPVLAESFSRAFIL